LKKELVERVQHQSIAGRRHFKILPTDKDKIVQKSCFGLIEPIKIHSSVAIAIKA
jgi:hypothetical protein